MALFELNQTKSFTNGYGGRNLPDPGLGINGLYETTSPTNLSSTPSKNEMASYAARLDYSYQSLYLLTASFRGDGSSKFPQNQWGYFPSLALAWNFGNESFIKNKVGLISSGKLRASIGTSGNNRVADYATFDQISLNSNYYGYSFNNQVPIVGLTNLIGNKGLMWEKLPPPISALNWESLKTGSCLKRMPMTDSLLIYCWMRRFQPPQAILPSQKILVHCATEDWS